VRVPLAGPYRPWATLYRLPDGRLVWCLRCWEVDRALVRCVSTDVLRTFAELNRLPTLRGELDRLVAIALGSDVVSSPSD